MTTDVQATLRSFRRVRWFGVRAMRTRRSHRNQGRLWLALGAQLAATAVPPEPAPSPVHPHIPSRRDRLDAERKVKRAADLEASRARVRAVLANELSGNSGELEGEWESR